MKIEDVINGKYAVHCDTKQKAKKLIKELYKRGYKWGSSKADENVLAYRVFKDETCYNVRYFWDKQMIQFDRRAYYYREGYIVVKFDDLIL